MKNRFIISALLLMVLFASCSEKKNQPTTSALPDSVEVFVLKKEEVTKQLSLPAELHPWERAEMYAKVQGYIKDLKVDIGDRVRKNDVLALIDAPEVIANYAKSSADLQSVESKFKTSKDHYNRILNASKEVGSVSASELERAKNQMLSDSANSVAAQSGANAYNQMKNYLVIRAAFNGVITERNVNLGSLVGNEAKPMFVLENSTKLRLRVAIPEAYTSAFPDTTFISFTVDAQPSKKYKATLARKSNQIDAKTRTELWEFEVDNSNIELKSGMYGKASFTLHRNQPSFVVPYSAVVTNLERNFVIRIVDGKVEWIDVRNGISMKDKFEIFGDLQEGDQLVSKANDEIINEKSVVVKQ